jgi:exonuclease III
MNLAFNYDDLIIRVTTIYGPTNQQQRIEFYKEIRAAKPHILIPWMITGDFNVTLDIQDRSNTNHSTQEMV